MSDFLFFVFRIGLIYIYIGVTWVGIMEINHILLGYKPFPIVLVLDAMIKWLALLYQMIKAIKND